MRRVLKWRRRPPGFRRKPSHRPSIESIESRLLLATITVTSTADTIGAGGGVTLREAILSIDNHADLSADVTAQRTGTYNTSPTGFDTIAFNIPATDPNHLYYQNDGVAGQVTLADVATTTAASDSSIANIDPDWAHSWFSIRPLSALPNISSPVVIDGYTQGAAVPNTNPVGQGLNSVLRIEIDGANAGEITFGMFNLIGLGSGNNTIRGLDINRVQGVKILLQDDTGNNQIQGDYIGPDISGTQAFPTPALGGDSEIGFDAVRTRSPVSSNNVIGGTTPAARNLISGNTGPRSTDGIFIANGTGLNNVVQGNLIGTDRSGTKALPNGLAGVQLATDGNTVGGAAVGAGNVISGNSAGIIVNGNNSLIQNNRVGTDVTSTLNVGNTGGAGIGGSGTGSQVVGNTVEFNNSGIGASGTGSQIVGNTVAFNGGAGVSFDAGTLVSQNVIFPTASALFLPLASAASRCKASRPSRRSRT
jgi:hypothetical protein